MPLPKLEPDGVVLIATDQGFLFGSRYDVVRRAHRTGQVSNCCKVISKPSERPDLCHDAPPKQCTYPTLPSSYEKAAFGRGVLGVHRVYPG